MINYKDYEFYPQLIFFLIILINALFAFISTVLLYLIVDSYLLYILYKQVNKIDERHQILVDKRKRWIITLLDNLVETNRGDFWVDALKIDDKNKKGLHELGLSVVKSKEVFLNPDIEEIENELIRLEERASFLIASTVLLPVIFAMIHIFNFVPLAIFLIEIQIVVILVQILTINQQNSYQVRGWAEAVNILRDKKEIILREGLAAIPELHPIYNNKFNTELGLSSSINNQFHSYYTVGLAIDVITKMPAYQRENAFSKLFEVLRSIPAQERMLNIRWTAYRTRMMMISTIGAAVSGILASLSLFNFGASAENPLPIASTPYLPVGLGVLTVIIAALVMRAWVSYRQLPRWIVVWSFTYYLTFALSKSLFV